MIDVTITATCRPEILDRTLDSFTKNLFFRKFSPNDYKVYINVDPVGLLVPSEHVVAVCNHYFTHVKFRIAKESHFPTAFLWCWKQCTSPYVFHLEEDWELIRPLSLKQMINIMIKDKALAHLRLSMFRSEEHLKNWRYFFGWSDYGYFRCPQDVAGTVGWCGHPSLNRLSFVKAVVDNIDSTRNTEKQIKWRNKALWSIVGDMHYGCFQEKNSPPSIKDIGRKWMIEHGFKKKGNKEHFTMWENVK